MANRTDSEHIRLKELGKSKFEVAKNESDIRGWTVKNGQGRILGKVSDLLFDIESEKVLYMVLDLEGNEMHLRDRKVLAPLSIAQIHEAYQNVVFSGNMANELTELPTYEVGKVSTRIEDIVHHAFVSSQNHNNRDNDYINKSGQEFIEPRQTGNAESRRVSDDNQRRPQTVVGVFERTSQGQSAIEYLLNHDFKRNQIDISSKADNYGALEHNDDSVTNWFKSIFGNENEAKTYSDAAKTGCVITIQTSSLEEAEQAAEILDKHGALSINDNQDAEGQYKSRILDRKNSNLRMGY